MDIPMDIVSRRRNRRRIAVPQNIIGNNKDLPGSILIKYTDTIEVEKVDNIVRHKYNILKQQNKNLVLTFLPFFLYKWIFRWGDRPPSFHQLPKPSPDTTNQIRNKIFVS